MACTSASTAAAGWQNCFIVVVSQIVAVVIVVLSSRHCTSIVNGQTKLKLMMDKQQATGQKTGTQRMSFLRR